MGESGKISRTVIVSGNGIGLQLQTQVENIRSFQCIHLNGNDFHIVSYGEHYYDLERSKVALVKEKGVFLCVGHLYVGSLGATGTERDPFYGT